MNKRKNKGYYTLVPRWYAAIVEGFNFLELAQWLVKTVGRAAAEAAD